MQADGSNLCSKTLKQALNIEESKLEYSNVTNNQFLYYTFIMLTYFCKSLANKFLRINSDFKK